GWPLQRFLAYGGWLQQWLQHRGAILIASGDLSHRLTPDAPYGFRPEGPVFDRLVIDALRGHDWQRIEGVDPDLVEEAGECGLRPPRLSSRFARTGRCAVVSAAPARRRRPPPMN